MSTRAFALKYRPQTFEDVVGQETTVRILKNLLQEKRIHHAYLLTGPRGTGKTSVARIFAKAINCEQGPTPIPCGRCTACVEITEGRSFSVLEIDGASNTSVDDVRELRDKIRYLAPGGRYKIYIIDEVHMLSTAAFNALLKTLEEPPPHALFLFATTEPQKLPITIISRCLRFDLRPITTAVIVQRLRTVAQQEAIKIDEEALFEIAREASGGLRDALGLLDQAASFGQGQITLLQIEEIIGSSPRKFVLAILATILTQDPPATLLQAQQATAAGIDPKRLALELLEYLRHLLVVRISADTTLFDLPPDEIKNLKTLGQKISESAIDQLFRMLQHSLPDLLRSPTPQILLDVLLLRLCHYQELESLESILRRLETPAMINASSKPTPAKPSVSTPSAVNQAPKKQNWGEFLNHLRQKKPQLNSIVDQCSSVDLTEQQVTLAFPAGSIHLEMLKEPERLTQLQSLVNEFFGRTVRVQLTAGETAPAMQGVVDEAISIFKPSSMKTVPSR